MIFFLFVCLIRLFLFLIKRSFKKKIKKIEKFEGISFAYDDEFFNMVFPLFLFFAFYYLLIDKFTVKSEFILLFSNIYPMIILGSLINGFFYRVYKLFGMKEQFRKIQYHGLIYFIISLILGVVLISLSKIKDGNGLITSSCMMLAYLLWVFELNFVINNGIKPNKNLSIKSLISFLIMFYISRLLSLIITSNSINAIIYLISYIILLRIFEKVIREKGTIIELRK